MDETGDVEITAKDLMEVRPNWTFGTIRTFTTIEDFIEAGNAAWDNDNKERKRQARLKFLELIKFPEFWEMGDNEKGASLGITDTTVRKWLIQVPDSVLAAALKLQRERSVRRSLEVDSYLMKQCKEGNVKAMELYYRRIEGWEPKQAMELSRGRDKELEQVDTVDLIKGLMEGMSAEQRKRLVEGFPGGGGADGNTGGIEGVGDTAKG